MEFKSVPGANDPDNSRKPDLKSTGKGSRENLWKGRFDRRKVARDEAIDFPTPNTDQNTDKPADS